MSASIPSTIFPQDGPHDKPITMFGPDFPFAYDDYVKHPASLGRVPSEHHGKEVAIIGAGIAGMVTAYELMKLGLKPVIYEADRIGGRMRSDGFDGYEDIIAEMGAMRFPPSSTTLFHYIDLCGLKTKPFPNPLAPATKSTVVDLKGQCHYAVSINDLPQIYLEVSKAWNDALENHSQFSAMQAAIRDRDTARIKEIWDPLVAVLDDETFYGFVSRCEEFKPFSYREIFGQVGFGTGGWDTDFPNSILEILRVVHTAADADQQTIIGGAQRIPENLWQRGLEATETPYWPAGTSLESLNEGRCRPGVTHLNRTGPGNVTVIDRDGVIKTYPTAVLTAQLWMLLTKVRCDERLFPASHWTAIERTHYMQSSKTFVIVDRPFWKDKDPETGRDVMSMTLTDRMTRGTYLFDNGDDRPGVICLSYTWADDSLKWLPLSIEERVEVMFQSLKEIYPKVDIRKHMISNPLTISWENEPYFMGAFKANLPGHYRYQRRLYTHFMQNRLDSPYRGIFLAGDDVSWTAGWAEGAVTTALNAVWGVMNHFGGETDLNNPGPGDKFHEIAPLDLPDT